MLNRRPVNRRKDERTAQDWLRALGWRRLTQLGVVLGTLTGLGLGLGWLFNRPIQHVVIDGSFQRVVASEIQNVSQRRIAGAGLVSVDMAAVQRALVQLPWIDSVSVQRSWPRTLRISVVEQVAIARWNNTALINSRGELFRSSESQIPAGLPRLSGPEGTDADVVARFFSIRDRMAEAGAHLTMLQLDARGAWRLALDSGVEVRLGRSQVDERYQRFVAAALPLVIQRAAEIAYVDMRYTNGFAVGWKARAARLASRTTSQGLIPDA
jgi:cell division protein FtsQ